MIHEIRTAEQLTGLIHSGVGYLYNDFGGRDPKMCPIHSVGCRWIPSMLRPSTGKLGVPKLWCEDLDELVAEVEARGKVHAFCRSEPDLAKGGGSRRPGAPAVPRPHAPRDSTASGVMPTGGATGSERFRVLVAPGVVTVASAYRLQFDQKPRTKALKREIGDAVEQLVAGPGQILEAVYTAASQELVDAENVLLYNVGTGRFASSTHGGLRFERVYAEPPGGAGTDHHHHYAVVPADSPSSHWRRGHLVVEALNLRIPRLDALSKPDSVWFAAREGVPAGARVHSGRYALDLTLEVGPRDPVRPADVLKPLVDGLIAGLHAHDGRDATVVTPRLAARLDLTVERVAAMLGDGTRAWLGTRRLLWPRADGIQWNPADDECVSAVLRVRRNGGPAWQFGFGLYAVEPLA